MGDCRSHTVLSPYRNGAYAETVPRLVGGESSLLVSVGGGVYVSPTVGYRFNWARKMGVNLGLGMSIAGYTSEVYEGTQTAPDSYEIQYVGKKHGSSIYFTFRE